MGSPVDVPKHSRQTARNASTSKVRQHAAVGLAAGQLVLLASLARSSFLRFRIRPGYEHSPSFTEESRHMSADLSSRVGN